MQPCRSLPSDVGTDESLRQSSAPVREFVQHVVPVGFIGDVENQLAESVRTLQIVTYSPPSAAMLMHVADCLFDCPLKSRAVPSLVLNLHSSYNSFNSCSFLLPFGLRRFPFNFVDFPHARHTESELCFQRTLSRLGITDASIVLLSLLHRFVCSRLIGKLSGRFSSTARTDAKPSAMMLASIAEVRRRKTIVKGKVNAQTCFISSVLLVF